MLRQDDPITGAFSAQFYTRGQLASNGTSQWSASLSFNADKSNAIYKNNGIITPKSLNLNNIIKC